MAQPGTLQATGKWIGAIAIVALALAHRAISTEADAQSVPQLIYETRKGLDVTTNEFDKLINTFGFICFRNPYNPKPCRIETELISFLRALTPSRAVIAHKLSALGAVCDNRHDELTCAYRRDVESAAWISGSPTPKTVTHELFRIELKISGADDLLRFEARFDRTSKVKAALDQ